MWWWWWWRKWQSERILKQTLPPDATPPWHHISVFFSLRFVHHTYIIKWKLPIKHFLCSRKGNIKHLLTSMCATICGGVVATYLLFVSVYSCVIYMNQNESEVTKWRHVVQRYCREYMHWMDMEMICVSIITVTIIINKMMKGNIMKMVSDKISCFNPMA